jgi:DNA-binding MarR family transcriptional regulator
LEDNAILTTYCQYGILKLMKRTPEGDLFTSIVIKGMQLTGLLEKTGDALTKSSGQTAARWQVLGGLDENPKTVAEIARSLNLSRQGIQRIANALTQDGLTHFISNAKDQRADLLSLTDLGREALFSIQAQQRKWSNRLGKKMGRNQIIEVNKALEKLIISLMEDSDRE